MMAARSGSKTAAPKTYQNRTDRLFLPGDQQVYNEREDVNVIKQFCDTVCKSTGGALIATRLLAHKIQFPITRGRS